MIILVINLGLKSARTIAFSVDGEQLAQSSHAVHTYLNNGKVEQNPNEWLDLTFKTVGDVMGQLGSRRTEVRYITVTTSASCLVALDENSIPLRNSILVSDSRATTEAKSLDKILEFQKVCKLEGCKSSPDQMLPKILWVRKHEPEIFKSTDLFVNAGDFIVGRLTGRYVTDVNNATKFVYRVSAGEYPQELYAFLGLDTGLLPEVLNPGDIVGNILPDVAELFGAPKECEVVLSTYDALVAVTGAGAFQAGQAVDVSGTVTSFRAISQNRIFDPKERIYQAPYIRDQFLVGGSNNLGGGVIEWVKQVFYDDNPAAYELIEKEAMKTHWFSGGLLFLPYLLGERAPLWDSDCRGTFFGLARSHGKGEMFRSVFEGMGYSVRTIMDVILEFDIPVETVTVSGGVARIDTISQLKADIFGVPVVKMSNFETTSIGAAIVALSGAGVYSDAEEAFGCFCGTACVFEPDLSRHKVYMECYELYKDVYSALMKTYKRRSELLGDLALFGEEFTVADNL